MKKYFVAYRSRGELPEVLRERTDVVVAALQKAGVEAYCNLYDSQEYVAQNLSQRQILDKAFANIDSRDGLFVLIASDDKSEGQLLELGYALAKGKHVITAIQKDAVSIADELADVVVRWTDLADLRMQLEALQV